MRLVSFFKRPYYTKALFKVSNILTSMKTVANDIIERVDYNMIVQHYAEPASLVKYESNPKFAYF